jgi:hypothetical protein
MSESGAEINGCHMSGSFHMTYVSWNRNSGGILCPMLHRAHLDGITSQTLDALQPVHPIFTWNTEIMNPTNQSAAQMPLRSA